jgi:hypothetical protein
VPIRAARSNSPDTVWPIAWTWESPDDVWQIFVSQGANTICTIFAVLCSGKSEALVRYATGALPNKLLVREYLTALPNERLLSAELGKTRREIERRR